MTTRQQNLLARQALIALDSDHCFDNGYEVMPGFFAIYNSRAGQSRNVVHHKESGFVYKYSEGHSPSMSSREYFGEVLLDGIFHGVRLPEFYNIQVEHHYYGQVTLEVSEYIDGVSCCGGGFEFDLDADLEDAWCDHAYKVQRVVNPMIEDTHNGNWVITASGEVVIFDFAF